MGTTTALEITKILAQQIGDYKQEQTTTILTNTNTHVLSTSFQKWDGGRDNTFVDWWLFVTDKANAGIERRVRNSYTANSCLNVFGSVWTTDAVQANVRIGRMSYTDELDSINDAAREIYPLLYKPVDDRTSVTTNSLLYEYALPSNIVSGTLKAVQINSLTSETVAEDQWGYVFGWDIVNSGNTLRLPTVFSTGYRVRLIGTTPLETLTNTTDTISVDGASLQMLLALAKYKLYLKQMGTASSADVDRYRALADDSYREYVTLEKRMKKMAPVSTMNLRTYTK